MISIRREAYGHRVPRARASEADIERGMAIAGYLISSEIHARCTVRDARDEMRGARDARCDAGSVRTETLSLSLVI